MKEPNKTRMLHVCLTVIIVAYLFLVDYGMYLAFKKDGQSYSDAVKEYRETVRKNREFFE